MAQISRLKDEEIQNGNLINAGDLDAEFSQLVSESNSQDTRLTALESGTLTISGVKTFSSNLKAAGIDESVVGDGVSVESVLLTNGVSVLDARQDVSSIDTSTDEVVFASAHAQTTGTAISFETTGTLPSPLSEGTIYYARSTASTKITVHPTASDASANTNKVNLTTSGTGEHIMLCDPASPSDGSVWYNRTTDVFKAAQDGSVKQILLEGDAGFPTRYRGGPPVTYTSASTVTIPSGCQCRDKADTYDIVFSSSAAVSLASSGANGLDTGSEATSTWYYLYAIADSTGVHSPAGLLSTVNEAVTGSITLPSGYDVKRQLPIAIRNNSSGDIIPFDITGGWPDSTIVTYRVPFTPTDTTTRVLSAGTATTYTAVSMASFIPPNSASLFAYLSATSGGPWIYLRTTGQTNEWLLVPASISGYFGFGVYNLVPDSSSQIDYKLSSGSLSINVMGYVWRIL